MHILKKIKRAIAEHNPEITKDMIIELYEYIASHGIFATPVEIQEEVLTKIYNGLMQKYESGEKFTIDQIKEMATDITRKILLRYHKEKARELAFKRMNEKAYIKYPLKMIQ